MVELLNSLFCYCVRNRISYPPPPQSLAVINGGGGCCKEFQPDCLLVPCAFLSQTLSRDLDLPHTHTCHSTVLWRSVLSDGPSIFIRKRMDSQREALEQIHSPPTPPVAVKTQAPPPFCGCQNASLSSCCGNCLQKAYFCPLKLCLFPWVAKISLRSLCKLRNLIAYHIRTLSPCLF